MRSELLVDGGATDPGAGLVLRGRLFHPAWPALHTARVRVLGWSDLADDVDHVGARLTLDVDDHSRSPLVPAPRALVFQPVHDLRETTMRLLSLGATQPDRALAVAVPYLMMCGFVLGGWLMARAAKLVGAEPAQAGSEFNAAKLATAGAYIGQLLPRAAGYRQIVVNGADCVADVPATLI